MKVHAKTWLSLAAGLTLFAAAEAASACCTPPPPCCAPPPPPPPPQDCGCNGGHTVVVPGVNVYVQQPVVVTAGAGAVASAGASAQAGATVFLGGGSSWYLDQPAPTLIQNLNVEAEAEVSANVRKVAYQATRRITKKVVIRASCLDDRDVPHPASQVHADRDVADDYEGEIFRCIAGTRMQASIADWREDLSVGGGETLACDKAQALWHAPGGAVECRAQKPARDCNERSLLRRYGAGVKVLTLSRTEAYTAFREEGAAGATARAQAAASSLMLDGGVGGVVR